MSNQTGQGLYASPLNVQTDFYLLRHSHRLEDLTQRPCRPPTLPKQLPSIKVRDVDAVYNTRFIQDGLDSRLFWSIYHDRALAISDCG